MQPGALHPPDRRQEPDRRAPRRRKLSKGDRFRREKYGDRAIELLRRAVRGGFLNLEVLQSDTDLDAIRGRADFQDLVKEVEKQSAESPKVRPIDRTS